MMTETEKRMKLSVYDERIAMCHEYAEEATQDSLSFIGQEDPEDF